MENIKVGKKFQETIGKAEQMLAQECCAKNLDKEIEATKNRAI